jgi:hypothetical protein
MSKQCTIPSIEADCSVPTTQPGNHTDGNSSTVWICGSVTKSPALSHSVWMDESLFTLWKHRNNFARKPLKLPSNLASVVTDGFLRIPSVCHLLSVLSTVGRGHVRVVAICPDDRELTSLETPIRGIGIPIRIRILSARGCGEGESSDRTGR